MVARKIFSMIKSSNYIDLNENEKINEYIKGGRIPWSDGYKEYKFKLIKDCINSRDILESICNGNLPDAYGIGVDERCVEYPWILSKLSDKKSRLLDAGSTFNFNILVDHEIIKRKELTIYTFYPEAMCFFKNRISYVYGDLREMFFKDDTFEEIVCQSTIEHIDMDNSIYGYDIGNSVNEKSFEYLKAIHEMLRVLKSGGKLLMTFPFGKYEYHGFFQQFDKEMYGQLIELLNQSGISTTTFFKYEKNGWRSAEISELADVVSYNPHSGIEKKNNKAAHSRGIACLEFIKK
ncbi:MAG TPA: methyltransferase domain-containing protein [Bacteroidia bacterium]|nr:methyltransferase domain-containing protein [Bacteroidia bacterium]